VGEVRRLARVAAPAIALEPAQLALAIGVGHGQEGTSAAGAAILARPAVGASAPVVPAAALVAGRRAVVTRAAILPRTPFRPASAVVP